jgi:hypothetical protein
MRMPARKQARSEPARHELPDPRFDGPLQEDLPLPAPIQLAFNSLSAMKAETTRARFDFSRSSQSAPLLAT